MSEHTEIEHARARWHEANTAIGDAAGHGNPPDPYRYAALLDARAGWWDRLGQLADRESNDGDVRDVYAIACSYAAILDRADAARVRFRYRIPTLHPSSVAELAGLNDNHCEDCGRPWLLDPAGTCPACPALLYGITPSNAAEAATYPPGRPWTPQHTLGQEHVSTSSHERAVRGQPLTEAEWTGLREFAWSPRFEPPAGTPERYRHDALRLALGEAERLAGRARSDRDAGRELSEILAAHNVMVVVNGHGHTPQLYQDLMQWVAINVERATYRMREEDVNQIPDKIPARVNADEPDSADGRVTIRQRPLPDQIDYFVDKLAALLDRDPIPPRDVLMAVGPAIVSLGAIAAKLRHDFQERDHAEAVELLGHLVDHEDVCCNIDDRGYCLEHHQPDPCGIPAARALLARIRGEQAGGEKA